METPAKRSDGGAFKTPKPRRARGSGSDGGTPVTIPASPFMKELGCGTGVSVYLMDRTGKPNASPWAVKKVNNRGPTKQQEVYRRRLSGEARLLRGIDHPNIVGFRAVATAKDGSKCLAMEYGGEQSLYDLIESRKGAGLGPFPADKVEKVALHMARGLQYLHNEKKLLHGDIKSCNVVVRGDFQTVKLCDVGMSLPLDENLRVSDLEAEYVGTEPWKPMEALEDGDISDKADVFAYGLTLWEMMTLQMPHLDMLEDEDDEASFDEDAYYERLGTRPPLDLELLGTSYRQMAELFYVCTEADPHRRPAAALVVQVLEGGASLHNAEDVIVLD